jgi:hypothetical protein
MSIVENLFIVGSSCLSLKLASRRMQAMWVLHVCFKSRIIPRHIVSLVQVVFSLKIVTGCVLW